MTSERQFSGNKNRWAQCFRLMDQPVFELNESILFVGLERRLVAPPTGSPFKPDDGRVKKVVKEGREGRRGGIARAI